MSRRPEPVERELVYEGRLISLFVERWRKVDGTETIHELVCHPGAAGVLPVLPDGRLVLVEQYRPAVRATSLEIPAGKLESGEDPLRCAKRELLEETGYGAGRWTPLLTIYTTPGFTNERIWLYRSENVRKFGVPRPGEIDRLRLLTLREAMDALARGAVADAKTALALQMHAAHHAASSQD